MQRVNQAIRQALSKLILEEAEDPRVHDTMITLTRVDTTRDLRHAKVFFSVLRHEDKERALEGLYKARPFFIARLKQMIRIRHIPALSFQYDKSLEEMNSILKTLNKIDTEKDSLEHDEDS
jgi:ribosome-binding factor A